MAIFLLTACAADCSWSGRGEAWIDQNQDGVWDSTEPPLEGANFAIHDLIYDAYSPERMISAKDGNTDLYFFLPGCPRVELEVSVYMPAGYRLTTDDRVPVRKNGEIARFGFVPAKD